MKKIFSMIVTITLLAINAHTLCDQPSRKGNVIILSGTSTSGKTSIAKDLASFFEHPFEHVAFDDFLTEVFLEQLANPLPEQNFLARIHQRISDMYDTIRDHALQGNHILVDTVLSALDGEKDVQLALEKLQNINVTALVLVYCPLPILAQRISERNQKALAEHKFEDIRSITYVKFHDLFRPRTSETEIALDTLSRKDIELAYAVPAEASEQEAELYNQLKATLLSHFDLIDNESVIITPKLEYDCIVNTSTLSPQEAAQKIYDCITSYDLNAFKRNYKKLLTRVTMKEKTELILETKRLALRKFVPEDAMLLAPIIETITHEQFAHLSLLEYAQGFIEHSIIPSYEKNCFGLWALIDKNSGKLIGYCGLHKVEVSGQERIELAYRIAKDFRSQGLATEAAITVRNYGYNVLKIPEIVSCIAHDNIASIRVAEKVGSKYLYDGEMFGKPCKVYQITRGK
jgi:RimJ/RimL family protein N-acetyltransferase/chloramphenicol 3-O-phosphotransferase